jgi:flagellar biosynthesis protein FliQ
MSTCMRNCLRRSLPWWVGAGVIGAIVAYFIGITILTLVFPPGVIAALVALVGIWVLGYLVAIARCNFQCRRAGG